MSDKQQWTDTQTPEQRPQIKDFFGEDATLPIVMKIYEDQPELFKYAQALDNYIDEVEAQASLPSASPTTAGESKEVVLEQIASVLLNLRNPSGYFLMDNGKCYEVAEFIYNNIASQSTPSAKLFSVQDMEKFGEWLNKNAYPSYDSNGKPCGWNLHKGMDGNIYTTQELLTQFLNSLKQK